MRTHLVVLTAGLRPRRYVLGVLPLLLVASCTSSSGPREIVVVARGMTFVLPSDPDTANPVIRVRRGERINLTFRNEAPGLMHDFRIPSWNVQTEQVRGGESTTVSFTVPGDVGRYEYNCGPHATMMRGFIEVTAN